VDNVARLWKTPALPPRSVEISAWRPVPMARAIWSGSISFGMVTIPVKLFGATSSKDIRFHLVHATCGTKLEQRRWCPKDEVEVPWNETARAYEYAKGRYVTLTDEDFERLPLPSKHTIELSAFVEEREIDPIFYERTYYLEPEESGKKPYALLLKALNKKGLSAVATIAIRSKEQLCVLRPHEGTIMLETLYYPDEIRLERGDLSDVKVSDRELEMAFTLIDIFRKPFDPSEYQDHYREALAQLIEAKLAGKEMEEEQPATREARVFDLADALKRSVEAARKGKAKPPARAPARRAGSRRRTRKVG
jgi:DNA end-binding protein Ku